MMIQSCNSNRFIRCCLGFLLFLLLFCSGCSAPKPYQGKPIFADSDSGSWRTLDRFQIHAIYGVGLSYAQHIEETGSGWDPERPPPVFRKSLASINTTQVLPYPARTAFLDTAEELEAGLAGELERRFPVIDPLVDYEVELALVLLEPFNRERINDSTYMPRLGFVLAGDLTSRTFMVLGEGKPDRLAYWGAAKSFPGFSVIGSRMWVPDNFVHSGTMNVILETRVNGQIRQRGNTADRVYSARQMMTFVAQAFPDDTLAAGTVIMTGTPPGVAFTVPGWKRAFADILGLNRFTRMEIVMKNNAENPAFLKPGDSITFEAGPFGSLSFSVVSTSDQENEVR